MKVGNESRGKLIAAVVLMVLAVVLVGQWLFSSGGSSSEAAPSPARPSENSLALQDPMIAASSATVAQKKGTHPKKETARSLDPTLRYEWLKGSEDTEYKGSGRNIFQAQMEIPKPQTNGTTDHTRKVAKIIPVAPPAPPPPPPIELKFFGFASHPGEAKKIFLKQGEDVFIAAEGEIVDRRYKVLRISPTSVEIEDVLNNNRQEIPLTQG
jgi:hypothetical protein